MKKSAIALGVMAALLLAGSVFAQGRTGTLQLIAEADDGSRLPGATVTAEAVDVLGVRTAITDGNGVATLAGLNPSTQYVVTTTLDGFQGNRNENVLIKAGQTTTVRATLGLSSIEEELIVTAESPIVDVTSSVTGQDITLELTESLPTGRSYQNYLQLVPGVMPVDPTIDEENPAVRSGLNYRDIGGDIGVSRDNFYYFEGINVTDPVQGTFGANLNTEIIQEQSVLTGGIPAEFIGSPGLISNVVTKSGGNQFSGSINYFFQNESLVEDNDNAPDSDFSTYDTAFTLGGPFMKDKLWFFASYRETHRELDVLALDNNEYLRTPNDDSEQAFAKLSWAPTQKDSVTAIFLNDPTFEDGSFERDVVNNRSSSEETGGDRFTLNYSHVFGNAFVDAAIGEHNGERSVDAVDTSTSNDIIFRPVDNASQNDAQLGGFGSSSIDERDSEFYRASAEFYFDTGFGDHSIKVGYEFQESTSFRDTNTTGNPQAVYTSLGAPYIGGNINAANIADTGNEWSDRQFDVTTASDFNGLISAIDASANRASFYALLDSNGDGVITMEEAGENLIFNSTADNPHGLVNYDRTLQVATGPQTLGSEGTTWYIQDTFQFKRLSINAGVRAEEYEHFATTGENIFTFDYEYAPRISVAYDVRGDGRQKISAYYGRYYDPIRNNMTQFAGTLTGRVRHEQVFINGEWLTYRIRGGDVQQDAFFAPTTETPYTDDFTLGYSVDLGRSMSFEANLIKRETRDILEDYDLSLYALAVDGTTAYPEEGLGHPDSLWLGLDYFGYDANPGSNFVIATLAGGARDWEGLELVFRKRYSNNWQMLASATFADGEGNSNSDSNADFQGDVLFLDPRAPNQLGTQPGLIEQLFKVAASYQWDNGFQVGGQYRWNSGTIANITFRTSRRNLPIRVEDEDVFEFAGITNNWLRSDAVGQFDNPSWGTLDLRGQYNRSFGKVNAEFFVDIFNVFDEQKAIRLQDLEAGAADQSTDFGDGLQFIPPRRYFVGIRFSI